MRSEWAGAYAPFPTLASSDGDQPAARSQAFVQTEVRNSHYKRHGVRIYRPAEGAAQSCAPTKGEIDDLNLAPRLLCVFPIPDWAI